MELVKQKIAENRTNQRFILLEGLLNNGKLADENDRLQMRLMDEFFSIMRECGPIAGCIDLRAERELTEFKAPREMIEEPVEEEEKKEEPKPEGEGGEEQPPAE